MTDVFSAFSRGSGDPLTRSAKVQLVISCKARDEAEITGHLGIAPSCLATSEARMLQPDGTWSPCTSYSWVLDSPQTEGELGSRLSALADLVEPFAHRLETLNPRFRPEIRVTCRSPFEELEIIEFQLSPSMMGRFASWKLAIQYQNILFAKLKPKAQTP